MICNPHILIHTHNMRHHTSQESKGRRNTLVGVWCAWSLFFFVSLSHTILTSFYHLDFFVCAYNAWPRKKCDSRHAYAFSVKQTCGNKTKGEKVHEKKRMREKWTESRKRHQTKPNHFNHFIRYKQKSVKKTYENEKEKKTRQNKYAVLRNLLRDRNNKRMRGKERDAWMPREGRKRWQDYKKKIHHFFYHSKQNIVQKYCSSSFALT